MKIVFHYLIYIINNKNNIIKDANVWVNILKNTSDILLTFKKNNIYDNWYKNYTEEEIYKIWHLFILKYYNNDLFWENDTICQYLRIYNYWEIFLNINYTINLEIISDVFWKNIFEGKYFYQYWDDRTKECIKYINNTFFWNSIVDKDIYIKWNDDWKENINNDKKLWKIFFEASKFFTDNVFFNVITTPKVYNSWSNEIFLLSLSYDKFKEYIMNKNNMNDITNKVILDYLEPGQKKVGGYNLYKYNKYMMLLNNSNKKH